MSSYRNFRTAGQLVQESYYTDSSNYSAREKFRVVVLGGLYPFGTLSDDPGEPMYEDAVFKHAKAIWNENPIDVISEIGTVAP